MVQNISNEEYLEIKKLCLFCFKKYFKKWFNLKDDLVQEGIMNVLKYINDFDEVKSSFSSFCIRYAYYGMLTYLNNIYKLGSGRKYNNFDYIVISLDSVISSDNDKTTLSDLLPDNNLNILYNSILNKDCIKSCIKSALLKCCSFKEKSLKYLYSDKYRKSFRKSFKQEKYNILCDYLKTLSASETAKNCGVSRQFVSLYKIDFAKCLKKELEDNGYYN